MHSINGLRAVSLSVFVLAACIPLDASSQSSTYYTTNKVGPAACLTADAYDQYVDATVHARKTQDTSRMAWLYNSGQCFRMKKGAKATLVDSGFTVSQIRLYAPTGEAVLVWTASENIKRRAQSSLRAAIGRTPARTSGSSSYGTGQPYSVRDVLMTASWTWILIVIVAMVAVFLYAILPAIGVAFIGIFWFFLVVYAGSMWGFFGVLFSIGIPSAIVYAFIAYMDKGRPRKLRVTERSLRFHEDSVRIARTHRRHTPWQEL